MNTEIKQGGISRNTSYELRYRLATDPNKTVMIPETTKEAARDIFYKANPLSGQEIPTEDRHVRSSLSLLHVLVEYKNRCLHPAQAEDLITLEIAKRIAEKELGDYSHLQREHKRLFNEFYKSTSA